MPTIARHFLPVVATAALMIVAAAVLSVPIFAVMVFQSRAASAAERSNDLLYAAGVVVSGAAAISVVVIFPLALLLERLARRIRVMGIIVPAALLLIPLTILLHRFGGDGQPLDHILDWPGWILAFAVIFDFYWCVLWAVKSMVRCGQKTREAASTPSAPPAL